MRIFRQPIVALLALVPALVSCAPEPNGDLVTNLDEFKQAVAALEPGDRVVLANGTWTDVELEIRGNGSPDQPIEITAEEAGKVIITGQSNISFSGEHCLDVSF